MTDRITRTSSSATPPASSAPPRQFSVPLSATRRGARLARLLATEQLRSWELPLDPARLVVAELAADAAVHGRIPGRSFRLTLLVTASSVLRIEVADTRGDRLPTRIHATGGPLAASGWGHGLDPRSHRDLRPRCTLRREARSTLAVLVPGRTVEPQQADGVAGGSDR